MTPDSTGRQPAGAPPPVPADEPGVGAEGRPSIPVVAEQLRVGTEIVDTGRVRLAKTVREREVVVDEPLFEEQVVIERVRVDRAVDGPVVVRQEGDTLIVPILEEVPVVVRQLMLREEVRITRRRVETRKPQRVTLRAEEVSVERSDIGDAPGGAPPGA